MPRYRNTEIPKKRDNGIGFSPRNPSLYAPYRRDGRTASGEGQVGDARERERGPLLPPVPFHDGRDGAPVFDEIVFEHLPHPFRGSDSVFLRLVFLYHVHGKAN